MPERQTRCKQGLTLFKNVIRGREVHKSGAGQIAQDEKWQLSLKQFTNKTC